MSDLTPDEMKAWIDGASYQQLLYKWRFSEVGSPFFQGDMGDYYAKVMAKKREEIGTDEAARASKAIGWERQ